MIITDAFSKYGNIESGRYLGVMESMIEADATSHAPARKRICSPLSTTRRSSSDILMSFWRDWMSDIATFAVRDFTVE